jgi:hypothetical protein
MTAEETHRLVAALRRRRLAAPARLLLEAHRPLRPLVRDAATFLTPLLNPLLGRRATALAAALDDDAALDELVEELAHGDQR